MLVMRVMNILYSQKEKVDTALLSVDADRALDKVEFPCLIHMFTQFGFGETLCIRVKLLCKNSAAIVLTNSTVSINLSIFLCVSRVAFTFAWWRPMGGLFFVCVFYMSYHSCVAQWRRFHVLSHLYI